MKSVENRLRASCVFAKVCEAGRRGTRWNSVCFRFRHLPLPSPSAARNTHSLVIGQNACKFLGQYLSVRVGSNQFWLTGGIFRNDTLASVHACGVNAKPENFLTFGRHKVKSENSKNLLAANANQIESGRETPHHRVTQNNKHNEKPHYLRGPFYVWRYIGTFGAGSQACNSTLTHTHVRRLCAPCRRLDGAMPPDHISHHERWLIVSVDLCINVSFTTFIASL